jgi:hypothetical protein
MDDKYNQLGKIASQGAAIAMVPKTYECDGTLHLGKAKLLGSSNIVETFAGRALDDHVLDLVRHDTFDQNAVTVTA